MATADRPQSKLKKIPVALIRENETALRNVDKKKEGYVELVESVRDHGILNPILVREIKDADGKTYYGLVDGLQRFSASKDAGLDEIPAHVMNVQAGEELALQVVANVHKIETKPVEYSRALQKIFQLNPTMTLSDMAVKLNKSPAWVSQRLKLVKLPDHVAKLVDDGRITLNNAYGLVELNSFAPDEVNNYLDQAQTLPPTEFTPIINGRVQEIRNARRQGKDPEKRDEFVPNPFQQKWATIRDEFVKPTGVAERVLPSMNASTPEDGFQAALAWVCHMDPISIEESRVKWEQQKAAAAAERDARKAEREQKKAAAAREASANAEAESEEVTV